MDSSVNLLIDFLCAMHPGDTYRIVVYDLADEYALDHDWTVIRGYSLIIDSGAAPCPNPGSRRGGGSRLAG